MVAFVFYGCFRLIIDVSNINRINVYIDKYIYIYNLSDITSYQDKCLYR